jgi:hypothetical protein
MSSRIFRPGYSPGSKNIDMPLAFAPQGAGAPVQGEGDPKGSYLVVARTGVGTYTVTSKDIFAGFIYFSGGVSLGTPAGQWSVCGGTPVHNANGTWTIPFTLFNVATATDIAAAAGNTVFLWLTFRDSSLLP